MANKTDKTPKLSPMLDGAWCWFADPRAIYYNGNVYAGAVSKKGNVVVASWSDGEGMDAAFVLHENLEQDDHANPIYLIRDSDQKILAFYSMHTGDEMYLRISTNAEDVSAWGGDTDLEGSIGGNGYTYPTPIQLTGEADDPIYLIFRSFDDPTSTQEWWYSKSTDDGATWAAGTKIYISDTDDSGYMKAVANGDDRIDFVVTNCHPGEGASSLYHFYYYDGNYYESDGTLIGVGPVEPADITQVYDGSAVKGWLWDIAIDGSGHPVIVYATFSDINDHQYCYARWNGSAWNSYGVVAGGGTMSEAGGDQDYYSGGIVLDHDDVNTVYLSREVNGVHEVWKYTTTDAGSSWSGEALTSGNNANNKQVRPFVIRNHSSDTVMWMVGKYAGYTDYKTNIVRR